MSKIRVLLVDDHHIVREGLHALLAFYDDVQVVGDAEDGAGAVARVCELQPDIVLMDIAMPGMDGLEATRLIRQQSPQTAVLILSQHEERQYVLSLLQAGAAGYVLKRALGTDLINALRAVARGETFLYPAVAGAVVEEASHRNGTRMLSEALTPRESEILKHIALGQTNPEIALALSISVKTVEWHRTNLMSKLNLHNVADLVRYALQHNLV